METHSNGSREVQKAPLIMTATNVGHVDGHILEALARWIGDNYTGSELRRFFRNAGLQVPQHDGSTKWRWVLERLEECNQYPGKVDQVICRLVDPREYIENETTTVWDAINRMNSLLAPEGWEVYLDDRHHPQLRQVDSYIPTTDTTSVDSIEFIPADPPEFSSFVDDFSLEGILKSRWDEAQQCVNGGSYLAAIIIMGSILEACLLSAAIRDPHRANQSKSVPKDEGSKPRGPQYWSLEQLILVAHDCGWIQPDVRDFSQSLRDYRNMVHPWHQRSKGFAPDEDTCAVCWEVTKATINDLIRAFARS